MFDKYKKYRIISVIIILVAIVVMFATNVRIRSVKQYQSDAEKLAKEQHSISGLSDNDSYMDNEHSSQNIAENITENITESITDDSLIMSDLFNVSSEAEDNSASKEETAGNQSNDNQSNGGQGGITDSSESSNNISNEDDIDKDNNNSAASDENKPSRIISCTIEIRCDEATARKDSIDNPGIRELIPDSGIILNQITYSGNEGMSVYDVLSAVANMNKISIDTTFTTQYGGVYVRAIAGLEEKMVGRWSGWMYKVNGKSPNITASSYKVEDGDTIVWYYSVS